MFQSASGNVTVPVSVLVGADVFNQVNPVAFTKVFAGADPLPQTLTIASTAAAFSVGISVQNATGGNWLSVAPSGCCYASPRVITATVTTAPTMPVGTYTAQIIVTSQSVNENLTIPVTLTVAPASQAFFDNVPGQMSFSMLTGGTSITTQDIQIRNAGTGTLGWRAGATTADGGNWLNLSATTGTAPSSVTVSVSVADLPSAGLIAGTFIGELVFQADGSSVTVPVSVVVGANVLRQVNGIGFTKLFGGADPLGQVLTISTTGTAAVSVGISSSTATGGNWLTVSPLGCCYAHPRVIAATVNASPTLAVGTYTAQIVVTTQSADQAITIPVTLTVEAASQAYLDNLPGQMSFSFVTASGNPPTQSFQIRNAGSGTLNWTLLATTADAGNWLNVSAASGTAPQTVTVGITASALPGQGLIAGTFTGELLVGSAGSSVAIPVSVTVGANVFSQLAPLTFTQPAGGPNALPQVLSVASTGAAFNFGIYPSAATGGDWLTAAPSGCCYGTPRSVNASVNVSPTLPAGTYTGQIVFIDQAANMAMTVPVTLVVTPGAPSAPSLVSPGNGVSGALMAPELVWNTASGATSYDVYFGTTSAPPLVGNTANTYYAPGTLNQTSTYYWRVVAKNAVGSTTSSTWSFTTGVPAVGLRFVPVTPCRAVDTRGADGPFTGPTMPGDSSRSFAIPQSGCGIPATALAYSLNVTVLPEGYLGFLTLWPTGQPQAGVSTLNSWQGIVVANAAIVPAGAGGAVSVYVSNPSDVILDINGYFDTSSGPGSYAFYPATPCRAVDTRGAVGQFTGPSMFGGQTRDFPIPLSGCSIPATAQAYAMNFTVVPPGYLGFLSTWPTGVAQPNVSTLNSWTGKVVANAAIVPGGTNESISVYVSNPTDVIMDVNGYFGAPAGGSALSFYPVTPCRAVDTRFASELLGGPEMLAETTRSFPIPAGGCNIPSNAAAYSLNVTVVPDGYLGYLAAWPAGSAQPGASTLNSWDGSVVANAAIVPTGTDGAVSVYVTNPTNVIVDINGYFAP